MAHADGTLLQTNQVATGSGFLVVIEGGTGSGTSTFDLTGLPDLQTQVTHQLGNGSTDVCDNTPAQLGGVPGISPPDLSFSNVDAINDLACRFVTDGCLLDPFGEVRFAALNSAVQFCADIGPALTFPAGETVLSVRPRGTNGMVGPVRQFSIQVGPVLTVSPTRTQTVAPTGAASPTASPTPPAATATRTSTRSPTPNPSATRTSSAIRTAIASTHTPTGMPTETPPLATATGSHGPTETPPPTPAATATATHTPGALIDLDSLIHALFSPVPPTGADVNADTNVCAADVTEFLRLQRQ